MNDDVESCHYSESMSFVGARCQYTALWIRSAAVDAKGTVSKHCQNVVSFLPHVVTFPYGLVWIGYNSYIRTSENSCRQRGRAGLKLIVNTSHKCVEFCLQSFAVQQ